jgi:hypothetical protein
MFITKFSYQNRQTGWTLQALALDRFNLLVGASGVGKTQILRAFRTVQDLAVNGQPQSALSFKIDFVHGQALYHWEFESSPSGILAESTTRLSSTFIVTREYLTSSTDGKLVERDQDRFLFKGLQLPQLNRSESALQLLLNEESIHTICDALGNSILDDHPYSATTTVPQDVNFEELLTSFQGSNTWRDIPMMPPQLKALLLQHQAPEQFNQLKSIFKDIFPSIEDIQIELKSEGTTPHTQDRQIRRQLQFKLKEHGIEQWVPAESISSGMVRTLIHLVDLTLAPKDSVVLIDEFENSLGVNCMGPLTDFIQSRAPELQFIITSHHPYIINKIPKEHWKVVRRHGSTVQVTPASEVRALLGSSAQDDFTRLINAPEFEEGMP